MPCFEGIVATLNVMKFRVAADFQFLRSLQIRENMPLN